LYGFSDHFSNCLNEKIENDIFDLLEYSNAQDFVDEKENSVVEVIQKLQILGLNVHANLSEYSKYDWWSIGQENYLHELMQKDN